MKKLLRLLMILSVSHFTVACTTAQMYNPSQGGAEEEAIIKGIVPWFAFTPTGIRIKSVDGESVSVWASSVSVLPGDHLLEVVCQAEFDQQRYLTRSRLSVFALPGKTYYLESRSVGDQCTVSLVEG